jgi:hypothetical protein
MYSFVKLAPFIDFWGADTQSDAGSRACTGALEMILSVKFGFEFMSKRQNSSSGSSGWRQVLAAILGTAIVLSGAYCVVAADTGSGTGDVEIEVKAGFGGLSISRLGGWVPFRILVSNQGPPINGRLVVFADAPSNHQSREFSEDVQLPTGSKKLYEIGAYLNSPQVDPVVRLVQRSSSGDRVVAEAPVKIEQDSQVAGDLVQIGVVDVEDTALNNINSIPFDMTRVPFTLAPQGTSTTTAVPQAAPGPGRAARQGPGGGFLYNQRVMKARPLVIGPPDLPRASGSYDMLDALVLGGAPLSQLDLEQGKALRMWVAAGGLLIVTGGADFSGMRASGLDVMMPVDVSGTESVGSLPDLTNLYGAFDSADPILMSRARPRPGAKVLVGSPDRPIVVERAFGKGQVRYFAIDPKLNPLRSWKGSANLWQDVLVPAAQYRQRRFSLANFSGQMSSTLYDMAQVKPPSAGHLVLFLIAYLIVVGPLNYFALRWARKLDLAWLTIPVVVVVFTGFSILAARTSRGRELVGASISAVEVYQQDGVARTNGDLLLVFPSKSTHEVSFDSDSDVNDASLIAAGDPITTNYLPDSKSLSIPTEERAPISFKVREVTEGQQPMIAVEGADSTPVGGYVRVRNLTRFAITRAVVMTRAGMTDLFDLAPGEEQRCEIKAPAAQTFTGWYSTELSSGSTDAQVLTYLSPSFPYGGGSMTGGSDLFSNTPIPDLIAHLDSPILVGLGANDQPQFRYNGPVKRIGRQMFIIHV